MEAPDLLLGEAGTNAIALFRAGQGFSARCMENPMNVDWTEFEAKRRIREGLPVVPTQSKTLPVPIEARHRAPPVTDSALVPAPNPETATRALAEFVGALLEIGKRMDAYFKTPEGRVVLLILRGLAGGRSRGYRR